MSQQPPPPPHGGPPYGSSPYGGPPHGGPPYGGPPGQYPGGPYGGPPGGPPAQQPGWSNKAKFWIGVGITIPALFLVSFVTSAVSALLDLIGGDIALGSMFGGVMGLGMLGGLIAMIVIERTRWIALGMLAAIAVLLILAAGACVALFIALANSYNGGM